MEVARGFARGHRGIPLNDPVLAELWIVPHEVLFATNGRAAQEILANWEENIGDVTIKNFAESEL